jgi:excisionase family DNA binding protein
MPGWRPGKESNPDERHITRTSRPVKPHADNPARRLLKVKQAADYLGISAGSLRQLAQEQELRVVKLFGTRGPWLFDVKDLEQLIEARKELS